MFNNKSIKMIQKSGDKCINIQAQNIYIKYSELETAVTKLDENNCDLKFVTEDSKLDNNKLMLRFSIYNLTSEKIKIFNFKTIEYLKEQTIFYCGGPRCFLEISPEKPFIDSDSTFEIESNDSKSFKLEYSFKIGGGRIQIVCGLAAYYHKSSSGPNLITSDKLFLINPSAERIMNFDENDVSKILDTKDSNSFTFGWANSSAERMHAELKQFLMKHIHIQL